MERSQTRQTSQGSLRQRILTFVGALIVLSLLGSTISLYRITEVNRLLDAINRVSVPLGRLFTQIQYDSDLFGRELERGLGMGRWKDSHWKPRPVPKWISDVLESEVSRVRELMDSDIAWAPEESRKQWRQWSASMAASFADLRSQASSLYSALERKDWEAAQNLYPKWKAAMEDWARQVQWGAMEYERQFRQRFSLAESRVAQLRTGLEMILIVVISLSLLLLWFGERALRPLGELTRLAREITRRGLRKEDKALLPDFPLGRSDEVSQLGREFHRMATALLEREKTVELQKHRLVEQNRLLRDIGELNENILNSIESILIVVDLEGKVAQLNPVAARWLRNNEVQAKEILGTTLESWPKLSEFGPALMPSQTGVVSRIEPRQIEGRTYGGQVFPLRNENGSSRGAILVLDDLTEEFDLQERLRRAENLAAIGRMSAQVAHEVRNPLHSIGLEAEMAAETAARLGNPGLKQSLQSILLSVDRLQKITENYLKLSRLSDGEKREVDLNDVLESVLATYATVCEAQGVQVDWKRQERSVLKVWGDADLLEQIFGNLFRNALQALEGRSEANTSPQISWLMGNAESGAVWVLIRDNGPGIPESVRNKLFTPFVTTRAQGTGLGLSFVKKVMEDHGGSIRLREEGGASGSCFELIFPSVENALLASKEEVETRVHSENLSG